MNQPLKLLALSALFCGPLCAYSFTGPVTAVTGPDSFEMLRRKKTEQVTLAGITVPDSNAAEARSLLMGMLLERKVTADVKSVDADGYKVADVTLENGLNPAYEFLKNGIAVTVPGPTCTREMQQLENAAKLAARGVWAKGDAIEAEPEAKDSPDIKKEPSDAAAPGVWARFKLWWNESVSAARRKWHKFRNGN